MKKRIYTLIIFAMIVNISIGQNTTDWEKMNLKGKVKKLETGGFEESDSDIVRGLSKTFYFNSKGFLDSMEQYGGITPNTYSKTIYLYNKKMVLINSVKSISEDGQFANYEISDWRRRKMFYNSNGLLVKTKEVNKDTVLTREIKYRYDSLGRLEKVIEKFIENDVDRSNTITTRWTYNSNGSISNRTNKERNNRFVQYFNEKGHEVKNQWTYPMNSKEYSESISTYSYDEYGSWIKKHESSRDVAPQNTASEWKKDGGTYRTITYFE